MTAAAKVPAPFPYSGGKSRIAPEVWGELGDPYSYLEPFCGSAAMLLARPADHQGRREVIGDLNGYVTNAWRAIQWAPELTARWAWWPSIHADLTARHRWLVEWGRNGGLDRLMNDPFYIDPQVAGWWIWVVSNWISVSDACSTAFQQDAPAAAAALDKIPSNNDCRRGSGGVQAGRRLTPRRSIPRMTAGNGIAAGRQAAPDIIPLAGGSMGASGVQTSRPNNGGSFPDHIPTVWGEPNQRGTGVHAYRGKSDVAPEGDIIPRVADLGGSGIRNSRVGDSPVQDIIPAVSSFMPGWGVQSGRGEPPDDRIPNVYPTHGGRGVMAHRISVPMNKWQVGDHIAEQDRWLPWFVALAERLSRIHILNRPWESICKSRSVAGDFDGRDIGVFLDPPYRTAGRNANLYAVDDGDNVADAVWEWAKEFGEKENWRIALCALEGDYPDLPDGWREYYWRNSGGVGGGKGEGKAREVVLFSPHCLGGKEGGWGMRIGSKPNRKSVALRGQEALL